MGKDIEAKCLMCGVETGASVLCPACIDRMNNGEFSQYDLWDRAEALGFDMSEVRAKYPRSRRDTGSGALGSLDAPEDDEDEDRAFSSRPLKIISSADDSLLDFIMMMIEDYAGQDGLKWDHTREGVLRLNVDDDLYRAIGNTAVQKRGFEDISDYFSQMEPFE